MRCAPSSNLPCNLQLVNKHAAALDTVNACHPASQQQHGGSPLLQVGYCTLYTFYAYPDRKRYRLSQILVLPPFQRQGVAAALLKAVYDVAQRDAAIDVTVRMFLPNKCKPACLP